MEIWMEKRQSTRSYKDSVVSDEVFKLIKNWKSTFEYPHHETFNWEATVIKDGSLIHKTFSGLINKYIRVIAPHYLVLSSGSSDNDNENENDSFLIGFLGESFVKMMTESGIGTCWLGHSIPDQYAVDHLGMPQNHKYHILIAFGEPSEVVMKAKKRKNKEVIISHLNSNDHWLVDALLSSPSAMNTQPWYLYYNEGCYHYMMKPSKILGLLLKEKMKIDMGIGFYHIYDAIKSKDYRFTWNFEKVKNEFGEQILKFKYFD
jgi:hypothetical protein